MNNIAFLYPLKRSDIPSGIKVVTRVPQYSTQEPRTLYQCPDCCWKTHLELWIHYIRELGKENKRPEFEPFPFGHIVFEGKSMNGYAFVPEDSLIGNYML